MDISIFGYKLNLEILILIGVVYLILVGHTVCGCSNYSLMEAFDVSSNMIDLSNNAITALPTQIATGGVEPAGGVVSKAKKSVSSAGGKEGFAGANINYGQSSPYDLKSQTPVNTSSWSQPNLTVIPGKALSPGVKDFLARKQQPLPLKDGEMSFFANMEFKPSCCPNTYSNSMGCACMTSKDYNYLITRGGNNVPYSQY